MSGFVKLYRQVLENPVFRSDAEAMAFAWLVLKAAWRPTDVRYKGKIISLERGQLAVSYRDMAAALERSKDWSKRFLDRLATRNMTATVSATGVNVITICNYNEYQSNLEQGATPTARQPRQDRDRTATQNKEEKKLKKKEIDIPFDEIQARWNAIDGVTNCIVMNKQRRAAIGKRISEHGLESVWSVFAAIAESKFHCGGGPDGWKADIDHAFQPSSFVKHLEKGVRPIGSEKPAFKNDAEWNDYCEEQAAKWENLKPGMAEDWRSRKKQSNVVQLAAASQ